MAIAYIIDDELRSGLLLKAKIEGVTDYFTQIEAFVNPREAFKMIIKTPPDIIFTDIEMPVISGIDIHASLKNMHIPIVYVTAFSKYSILAIKQHVFDYILKPVKEEELLETISKFIVYNHKRVFGLEAGKVPTFHEILLRQNSKIAVNTSESTNLIAINFIVQIIGDGNYSRFIIKDQASILASKTLKFFEHQLVAFGFIRVHKSHLVNMVYVDKLVTRDGGYIQLRSSELIPISRDKKSEILEWFKN